MANRTAKILELALQNNLSEQNQHSNDLNNEIPVENGASNFFYPNATGTPNESMCTFQELANADIEPFQDSGSSYHPTDDTDSSEYETDIMSGHTSKRSSRAEKETVDSMSSVLSDTENVENLTRKRAKKGQADPTMWKRNKQMLSRMQGKEYLVETKQADGVKIERKREARELKELGCNSKKCRDSKEKRQCWKITSEQRKDIFNRFWSDLEWKQLKLFIATLVSRRPPKEKRTNKNISRRKSSLFYHLKVDNVLIPVCKNMFLSTFGIGEWTVHNWVKNAHSSGITRSKDAFPAKAKLINQERGQKIIDFFEKLPKLPSHYCRSTTSKMYLETIFHSYSEVYRLYRTEVDANYITSMNVFLSEMKNLSIDIFHPRKDQCDLCLSYKLGNASEEEYRGHIAEKDRARKEKELDKVEALAGNVYVLTVDVQAVQLVPETQASIVYFKQKLACHNYTIYNLKTDQVVCYVWHEGEGGMGGNCFASCLIDYIKEELGGVKDIIIYSDGCSAQNRNVTLSNALLHYAKTNGITIIQKYLVKGHSQMECDSVHSTIERRKKGRDIYSPFKYVEIIKESRQKKKPYEVKYLDHNFFNDYSEMRYVTSIRPGKRVGDSTVNDLRALRYSAIGGIQYKLKFDDDWTDPPQRSNNDYGEIKKLYESSLKIKGEKYEHLQILKKVLPIDYHGFYDSLNH